MRRCDSDIYHGLVVILYIRWHQSICNDSAFCLEFCHAAVAHEYSAKHYPCREAEARFEASPPIISLALPLFLPKGLITNFDGCVPSRMGSTLLKMSFLRTPHGCIPCSHLLKGILLSLTYFNPNLYRRPSEIQSQCASTLGFRFCLAVRLCSSPSQSAFAVRLLVCQLERLQKRHECHTHPVPLSRLA